MADLERMLDRAGDVALRALHGGRNVVAQRKPCGNGRGKGASRAMDFSEIRAWRGKFGELPS